QETLRETGIISAVQEQVIRLAQLGGDCGVGGLVASAHELTPLRALLGDRLRMVTPGIRPANSPPSDQKRTMSPADAFRAGADYLVIGRPIIAAADPQRALEEIVADAV